MERIEADSFAEAIEESAPGQTPPFINALNMLSPNKRTCPRLRPRFLFAPGSYSPQVLIRPRFLFAPGSYSPQVLIRLTSYKCKEDTFVPLCLTGRLR